MSETKGTYRLLYRYYNGNFKEVEFKGKKIENLPLTNIDLLTSQASNDEELIKLLNLDPKEYKDGRFVISYIHNHKERYSDIVFKGMNFLINLAKENQGNSKISKKSIIGYTDSLMNKLFREPEVFTFLSTDKYGHIKRRYMNSWVKGAIESYLFFMNSLEYDAPEMLFKAKVDLQKEFKYYKNIRDIEIGLYHYNLFKKGLQIPMTPYHISRYERAKREYELNNPKKVIQKKEKKIVIEDNQLRLFDLNNFENNNGKTKK